MKIAVILFTYNRSYHTKLVIDALRKNTMLPQKLFIFQDGLKQDCDYDEWKEVNNLIGTIDWCDKEIIVSEYNKGLSASIISGINYVFKDYEAVIVLEDDCVPEENYISFMEQCLKKYKDNRNVYAVSGYSWPINLPKDEYEVYGCGRISSWGWGTWKDRWEEYTIDNGILKRLKENKSRDLAIWGNDLEEILLGNISGQLDSWAVYWAMHVIENEGICVNPYKSLIHNIGMDGTRRAHSGITGDFHADISKAPLAKFILPEKIKILDTTEVAFASLYGNYTAVNRDTIKKEEVLIYGLGNFYFSYEKEINENYVIKAFIDKEKKGYFAGKKIIHPDKVLQYENCKIIIMVQNIQECINIERNLISKGIHIQQIVLGHNLYGKYSSIIDEISVMPDGGLLLTFGKISIKIKTEDEFNNVCEVMLDQIYNYYVNNGRQDIVLDVGMNIGDSVLYFLQCSNVKKVYGYEPFRETFISAQENLRDFLNNPERVEIFQYGISDKSEKRTITFNSGMTCGQSTIENVREKAYTMYVDWGLVSQADEEMEQIEVKNATEVFGTIIKNYPECNIILKMDCEGEEYGILENLLQSGLLCKISFIILEWHYRGKDVLLEYLRKAGFSWWCQDKSKEMGLIYSYK